LKNKNRSAGRHMSSGLLRLGASEQEQEQASQTDSPTAETDLTYHGDGVASQPSVRLTV